MSKRKNTLSYIIFYILFSVDTWRIAIGILGAYLLGPKIISSGDLSSTGMVLIWIMLICIGWSASSYPAKLIANFLKRKILEDAK